MVEPSVDLPQVAVDDEPVKVLAVSANAQDHALLEGIFNHTKWELSSAGSCREAEQFLASHPVAVVISERQLPDGTWKWLLSSLNRMERPPLLLVASPDTSVDHAIWAEVLTMGAYDVVSKPFDRGEVTRIVSLAWLHWHEEAQQHPRPPAPSGGETTPLSATA